MGHCTSSFVLTLNCVKAVWSFKFMCRSLCFSSCLCIATSHLWASLLHLISYPFPYALLYTRCVCGANITECVCLWVLQSLLRLFFDLLSLHYGAYIIWHNIYYCLCFPPSGYIWFIRIFPLLQPLSQLVLAESAHSDGGSQCTESHPELPPPLERTGGIGDSRPPSFQ